MVIFFTRSCVFSLETKIDLRHLIDQSDALNLFHKVTVSKGQNMMLTLRADRTCPPLETCALVASGVVSGHTVPVVTRSFTTRSDHWKQNKKINTKCVRQGVPSFCVNPAHKIRWPCVGLMLGQRRRRWTNIKPTQSQCTCSDVAMWPPLRDRRVTRFQFKGKQQ